MKLKLKSLLDFFGQYSKNIVWCLLVSSLCSSSFLKASETKPSKLLCLNRALHSESVLASIPHSDENKPVTEFLDRGIVIWKSHNDGIQVVTAGGTYSINSKGACNNTNPQQTSSSLVIKALNQELSKMLPEIGSKSGGRFYSQPQFRDLLHTCEGFSPDVDNEISKWWQKYEEVTKTAPRADKSSKN